MPFAFGLLFTAFPMPMALTLPIVHAEQVQLNPKLLPVCGCESGGTATSTPKQFNDDGTVLHGKQNKNDIGMCQINKYWNGDDAKRLGFDIYTEEGNIKMANYLFDTQGFKPWGASRSCWRGF